MKKSMIACIACMVAALFLSLTSSEAWFVRLSQAHGRPGDRVWVDVSLDPGADRNTDHPPAGGQMDLTFNPSVVRVVDEKTIEYDLETGDEIITDEPDGVPDFVRGEGAEASGHLVATNLFALDDDTSAVRVLFINTVNPSAIEGVVVSIFFEIDEDVTMNEGDIITPIIPINKKVADKDANALVDEDPENLESGGAIKAGAPATLETDQDPQVPIDLGTIDIDTEGEAGTSFTITITNSGGEVLHLTVEVNAPPGVTVSISIGNDEIPPGGQTTVTITITVESSEMAPGEYNLAVTVRGTDGFTGKPVGEPVIYDVGFSIPEAEDVDETGNGDVEGSTVDHRGEGGGCFIQATSR